MSQIIISDLEYRSDVNDILDMLMDDVHTAVLNFDNNLWKVCVQANKRSELNDIMDWCDDNKQTFMFSNCTGVPQPTKKVTKKETVVFNYKNKTYYACRIRKLVGILFSERATSEEKEAGFFKYFNTQSSNILKEVESNTNKDSKEIYIKGSILIELNAIVNEPEHLTFANHDKLIYYEKTESAPIGKKYIGKKCLKRPRI